MSMSEKLQKVLKDKDIHYELYAHPKAYTAQEVAHSLHKTGMVCAKSVIITVDGKYTMVVVPAPHKVNLSKIKDVLKAMEVHLAKEDDLRTLFPDSELGAEPALGNLYNLPVVIAWQLVEKEEIIFNAGTHTDCLKISYLDYEKLTQPVVGDISEIPL
jgi:Ala-tRNA(Pro) deacylase